MPSDHGISISPWWPAVKTIVHDSSDSSLPGRSVMPHKGRVGSGRTRARAIRRGEAAAAISCGDRRQLALRPSTFTLTTDCRCCLVLNRSQQRQRRYFFSVDSVSSCSIPRSAPILRRRRGKIAEPRMPRCYASSGDENRSLRRPRDSCPYVIDYPLRAKRIQPPQHGY